MSNLSLDFILTRGVAEIISAESLRARIKSGKPLRLKMGFDPSKPDLHIGHAVGLRKLRQLQELGHTVVLIVGDWTAQIGDPSGRDESRVMLTPEQVKINAETYMRQFFIIVDRRRTEVRWQSEWFGKFKLEDVFNITARFTLADMMEHETFDKRVKDGKALSLMELCTRFCKRTIRLRLTPMSSSAGRIRNSTSSRGDNCKSDLAKRRKKFSSSRSSSAPTDAR